MYRETVEQRLSFAPESFASFGGLLRFLRRRAQLRQRDLAVAVGYGEAQIGRLENGQRLPDVTTVMAQFVPALDLDDVPELAQRLIELARSARQTVDDLTLVLPSTAASSPPPAPEATITRTTHPLDLPHQPTPFLGRGAELAQVAALLHAAEQRCVTLLGSGGVGKTRLALQAASLHAAQFRDGVCLVPLAGVGSAALLAMTLAQALRLTSLRASDVVGQLQAHLQPKHLLLVLDNFEHLVEGAGLLVDLLAAAPHLQLLVTSRERLHIRGEAVIEVTGLPLPTLVAAPADLGSNTAVELFFATAQRLRPDLEASAAHLAVAARICRLVDGLPLAIELAAAWVHVLSLAEIEQELDRTLDFLQTNLRDVPSRHRSLRATFDHSWHLLTPAEQQAMSCLSMFRGSFTREAAATLLGANAAGTSLAHTLHVLGALVDKSLLKVSTTAHGSRYLLHDLVRQYAAEQLAAQPGAERAVAIIHSQYYVERLLASEPHLHSVQQAITLAALGADDDNLRAAIQWVLSERDLVMLRRIWPGLMIYCESRYATQEGLDLCRRLGACVANMSPEPLARTLQALALTYAGWFSFYLGRSSEALADLQAAHGLAVTDPVVLGDTLIFLGFVQAEVNDPQAGQRLLLAGLDAYALAGDEWRTARGYYRLGMVLHQNGAYVIAHHVFAACLARLRTLGDSRGIGLTLNRLGVIDALLGRYAQAQQYLQEGLWYCSAINDRRGMASALFHTGSVAQQHADHQTARYFFEECLQIFSDLQDRYNAAEALAQIGYSAAIEQDQQAAGAALAAAWQIVSESETITTALWIVVGRAVLDLAAGQVERAVEALALVVDHPLSEQDTRNRATRLLYEAEQRLTPEQFVAAQARGRTASLAVFLP